MKLPRRCEETFAMRTIEERLFATRIAGEKLATFRIHEAGPSYFLRPMVLADLPQVEALIGHDERGTPIGWDGVMWEEARAISRGQLISLVADAHVPSAAWPTIGGAVCYRMPRVANLTDPSTIDLVHLAVHPLLRRTGLGRSIVGRCLSRLSRRRPTLRACVDESHLEAQLFLSACGLHGRSDMFEGIYLFTAPATVEQVAGPVRGACPQGVR